MQHKIKMYLRGEESGRDCCRRRRDSATPIDFGTAGPIGPEVDVISDETGDSDGSSNSSGPKDTGNPSYSADDLCGTIDVLVSPESNTSTTCRGELDDFPGVRREGRRSPGEDDERESTDMLRVSSTASEAEAATKSDSGCLRDDATAEASKISAEVWLGFDMLGDNSLLLL